MVILGTPEVGVQVIARPNSIRDDDGIDLSTARFQWYRSGFPIPGGDEQFYTVRDRDAGFQLTVEYTYTDFNGTTESVVSNPKNVPLVVAPQNQIWNQLNGQ
jgi:hypothetical protein